MITSPAFEQILNRKAIARFVFTLLAHTFWFDSLIKLIIDIGESEDIDIKKGLPYLLKSKDPWDALELNSALCRDGSSLGGIWSHTNVRLDKVDVYPHPVLMAELKKL